MSVTNAKAIKVLGGYTRKTPSEILEYASAVCSGIYSDPADYPAAPVDEDTFKTAIDALSAKIVATFDGGMKATAERNQQETIVIKMMRELGHYVEGACKRDLPTFLKSGFQPRSAASGSKPQLSMWIRAIAQGQNSGQLLITLVAIAGATAYEIRYAPIVNGNEPVWLTQLVTKTRPAAALTGLIPGATYTIQVRSFNDATGFTDWSDPVTRIVT